MRLVPFAPLVLSIVLAACVSAKDASPFPAAQAVVDRVAARHTDLRRLTVHAVPAGRTSCMQLASTEPSRRGTPSDSEDLTALRTGKEIVLDEPGAIDVTVPILVSNGAPAAVAGVTLNVDPTTPRESAVQRARAIAQDVENAIRGADKPLW